MKPSLDRNALFSIVDYEMMRPHNLSKATSAIIHEELEKWNSNDYNKITEFKVVIHYIDNYE